MLSRTGKVFASVTLITASTIAFSSATLFLGKSNLSASNLNYGKDHSSMSILGNGSNLNASVASNAIANFGNWANLGKPNTYFCWRYVGWCS